MERVVEVTDLDAAHEVLSAAYARLRFSSGGRNSLFRMVSRMLGPVRFDRLGGSLGFEAAGEPMDAYVFGYLSGGHVRYSSDGGPAGCRADPQMTRG